MPELVRRTVDIYKGPWLLDRESLKAFDSMIDERMVQLVALKNDHVEGAVAKKAGTETERFQKLDAQDKERELAAARAYVSNFEVRSDERQVTLDLDSDEKLKVNRFEEAFLHPVIQNRYVTGFDFELRCGEVRGSLRLSSDNLTIHTSPGTSETAGDLFMWLEDWAKGVAPPMPIRAWARFNLLALLVLSTLGMILVFGVFGTRSKAQQEARDLLKKGLTKDDDHRAIELLLAIAADYTPEKKDEAKEGVAINSKTQDWWAWVTLILQTTVALILFFPPRTAIAIGRGEKTLYVQQRWIAFVYWLLKVFIVGGVIASVVAGLILR